jgi:hypothetical protein
VYGRWSNLLGEDGWSKPFSICRVDKTRLVSGGWPKPFHIREEVSQIPIVHSYLEEWSKLHMFVRVYDGLSNILVISRVVKAL